MNEVVNDLYVQIEDCHGAVASVFTSFDGKGRIVYKDSFGHKFFEEEFSSFPIEVIERYALDWALGKRDLSNVE